MVVAVDFRSFDIAAFRVFKLESGGGWGVWLPRLVWELRLALRASELCCLGFPILSISGSCCVSLRAFSLVWNILEHLRLRFECLWCVFSFFGLCLSLIICARCIFVCRLHYLYVMIDCEDLCEWFGVCVQAVHMYQLSVSVFVSVLV